MKNIELIRNVVDNLIRVSSEKSTQRGIFLACVAGGIVSKSYEAVERMGRRRFEFSRAFGSRFLHACIGAGFAAKTFTGAKNNSTSYAGCEIFLRASPVKKTLL